MYFSVKVSKISQIKKCHSVIQCVHLNTFESSCFPLAWKILFESIWEYLHQISSSNTLTLFKANFCLASYAIVSLFFLSANLFHCLRLQPAFTCLKSLIETPNNMWNLFKVNIKDARTMLLKFWCLFLVTLNRFHTFFWCFHCWLWTNKCGLELHCIP